MELNEVYFYMILILLQVFGLLILTCTEDLKSKKHFLIYLKTSLIMILVGCIMELLDWNYLCPFECIFFTSTPFSLILTTSSIALIFKYIFKKDPFQVYKKELSDGIWVKNKGNFEKNKFYYSFYSAIILIFPILLLTFFYFYFFKNAC